MTPEQEQNALSLLSQLSTSMASLSGTLSAYLPSIANRPQPVMPPPDPSLQAMAVILKDAWNEHLNDRFEAEREGRNGTWEREYFIEVEGKVFPFKTEEEAFEKANFAKEAKPGVSVRVYVTELKRYRKEYIPEETWGKVVDPTPGS